MKFIDSRKLSLDDFLDRLSDERCDEMYPNNHFPTDEMINEYLAIICTKPENEVKLVLRKFLIHNGTFSLDRINAESLRPTDKVADTEYGRRLFFSLISPKYDVWEGLTWIIDLLPHYPNEALKAIGSYFIANWQMLPDNSLDGLSDSMVIIRARYINYIHPKEVFWNLTPADFEFLVASLYSALNYKVSMTKSSYDEGIDINAEKSKLSRKEKIVIQCKRYTKKTIGVSEIRNLLGVVTDKKATKGIFVTTSKFSPQAKKFEVNNPSIELIDCNGLIKLLNMYHGTNWVERIDSIINNQKIIFNNLK